MRLKGFRDGVRAAGPLICLITQNKGTAFMAAAAIVMALLPQLGHLVFNEQTYGNHAAETPLPLTNAKGTIVYPGFPADVLFDFRLYSVAARSADRALRRAGRR
jgi:hypothetical protein